MMIIVKVIIFSLVTIEALAIIASALEMFVTGSLYTGDWFKSIITGHVNVWSIFFFVLMFVAGAAIPYSIIMAIVK